MRIAVPRIVAILDEVLAEGAQKIAVGQFWRPQDERIKFYTQMIEIKGWVSKGGVRQVCFVVWSRDREGDKIRRLPGVRPEWGRMEDVFAGYGTESDCEREC